MKLGKVIGNVVATQKDPGLDGLRLLIVQGLDDSLQPKGKPYVAADGIFTAGPGDIIYVVSKKEAAIAISKGLIPIDECVVGFVDEITIKGMKKSKDVTLHDKKQVITPKKKSKSKKKTSTKKKQADGKQVSIAKKQKVKGKGKPDTSESLVELKQNNASSSSVKGEKPIDIEQEENS